MQTATTYRYGWDKGGKEFICPQCGRKRLKRGKDFVTGEYLPDHVGRCNRENSCGYEYTWSQWLKEQTQDLQSFISTIPAEQVKPVDFLPLSYVQQTVDSRFYHKNNLYLFLEAVFTRDVALDLCRGYLIGTSSYWKGAYIYWQIDPEGNVRQCKIMLCDPKTGNRTKEGAEVERMDKTTRIYLKEVTDRACSMVYGKFLDQNTKSLNLEQTFFGAHLLAEFPEAPVCIVESEKTALIASVYLPQFIWLATGGASGCKWREFSTYKILQGRSVTFFPDHGYFNKKTGKTCYQEWCERVERIKDVLPGTFQVSDILEKRLTERKDQDLADLLLLKDQPTGLALTESGYPVTWDYRAIHS